MTELRTHRLRKSPQISARDLADCMAASEVAGRTIVRDSKYQAIGRVIQHSEARSTASRFIRSSDQDTSVLYNEAQRLRERLADSQFDRDLYDHNADYLDRFAEVWPSVLLPVAERAAPGPVPWISLSGVRVTIDLHVRLRRLTKTNKIRVGGVMLRYAKGKALSSKAAQWQSAFLYGYLLRTGTDPDKEPEHKLCITLDAYAGICHQAPTASVTWFKNMEATCASIAERWPNIQPPPGAIY